MSMIPMGEGIGASMAKSRSRIVPVLLCFLLGVLVTVAGTRSDRTCKPGPRHRKPRHNIVRGGGRRTFPRAFAAAYRFKAAAFVCTYLFLRNGLYSDRFCARKLYPRIVRRGRRNNRTDNGTFHYVVGHRSCLSQKRQGRGVRQLRHGGFVQRRSHSFGAYSGHSL